jgi:multiple sugar transport system permease protein
MIEQSATGRGQVADAARPLAGPQQSAVARFRRRHTGKAVAYLVLTFMAVVSLFPFLWMISTSLKGQGQIFAYPPSLIPDPIVWSNYPGVFDTLPFHRFFLNTTFYTLMVVLGQVLFCSLAGYAFARLQFPGRDMIFVLYLATLMIPATVTFVPSFILMREFGWYNTIWAMTVPGMFGSAFGTFLMRQFMLTIPSELDDAAIIDGASKLRIYLEIIVPLTKPAMAVLAVFTITTVWNDFIWPLIMLADEDLYTLTLGLARFQGGMQSYTFWAGLMAAATMTIAPLVAIFIVAQRFFTEGISLTGMGGR